MSNDPKVLQKLRTRYRVPQPPVMRHKLLRESRKVVGVPVFIFSSFRGRLRKTHFLGKLVYDAGAIFVSLHEAKKRNTVWHELCHAMVADMEGKMDRLDFGANQKDETLACQIELWLGFVSGFYTYGQLCHYLVEYGFSDKLTWVSDDPSRERSTWFTLESVERFLRDCREKALTVPMARKIANNIGVRGLKHLKSFPIFA